MSAVGPDAFRESATKQPSQPALLPTPGFFTGVCLFLLLSILSYVFCLPSAFSRKECFDVDSHHDSDFFGY